VESRNITIIGYDCGRGSQQEDGGGKKRMMGGESGQSTLYAYM
jgi:hypothetical protein